jgi:ABC-type transporter lipoprotein component MlaA
VLSVYPWLVDSYALFGVGAVNVVNARAQVLDQVRQAKEASLDYYIFVRNAYFQRRAALIADQQPTNDTTPTDTLYDLYDVESTDDAR